MEEVINWIKLIYPFVSGALFIALLIISLVRNIAKRKGDKETLAKTEGAFDLLNLAHKFMTKVESITGLTGEMKKDYVLTKLNQACLNAGVSFDEDKASQTIETLIQVSKDINPRTKDQEAKTQEVKSETP